MEGQGFVYHNIRALYVMVAWGRVLSTYSFDLI